MPLSKQTLAQDLEAVFGGKPKSSALAAADWAKAYVGFASNALSSAASLPVTAAANLPIVLGAFTGAFQAQSPMATAAQMAQGVLGFWSAMAWVGPTAAGATVSPGNATLALALGTIFADTSQQSDHDKADRIASAFDMGARLVIVSDVPFIQPAPPIVGPVS